jgi:hypothetical protein
MVTICRKIKTSGAAKFAAISFSRSPTSGSIPMMGNSGAYARRLVKLKIRAEFADETSSDQYLV